MTIIFRYDKSKNDFMDTERNSEGRIQEKIVYTENKE